MAAEGFGKDIQTSSSKVSQLRKALAIGAHDAIRINAEPRDAQFVAEQLSHIVKANAYDLVLNGNEIGGGSIRIHDKEIQAIMLKKLGFSDEEAKAQFGFLMDAFEYGAPPHGGIAFGFDRWCSLFAELDSIRDVIAFPKNNSGRDVMIDSPSSISQEQLKELGINVSVK